MVLLVSCRLIDVWAKRLASARTPFRWEGPCKKLRSTAGAPPACRNGSPVGHPASRTPPPQMRTGILPLLARLRQQLGAYQRTVPQCIELAESLALQAAYHPSESTRFSVDSAVPGRMEDAIGRVLSHESALRCHRTAGDVPPPKLTSGHEPPRSPRPNYAGWTKKPLTLNPQAWVSMQVAISNSPSLGRVAEELATTRGGAGGLAVCIVVGSLLPPSPKPRSSASPLRPGG